MATDRYVFDAYGTLFDVAGAARVAAADDAALAEIWPRLADDWRRKQLEYSWIRAITGDHADFWTVTAQALDWAAEAHGLAPSQRDRLLDLYRHLPAYPEAADAMATLRQRGAQLAIFSNGTPEMLAEAVASSRLEGFDALLSVETAGVYKPAAASYRIVTDHFGCLPGEITFVSSNGWDVYGATRFGFASVWVNRAGLPVDNLPARPGRIVTDLTGLA
ncbi:haloacid dehalogenase type II [uncultured Paracoccus sp.]|uniref:haloacid dehalogenase type II n=1 Tax=uncultured Paracoccus sp. TaxID=189685 RepID=UPI00262F121F|nr:haloacid dehalogenase type II [uncultured Paracoccus sp.]